MPLVMLAMVVPAAMPAPLTVAPISRPAVEETVTVLPLIVVAVRLPTLAELPVSRVVVSEMTLVMLSWLVGV